MIRRAALFAALAMLLSCPVLAAGDINSQPLPAPTGEASPPAPAQPIPPAATAPATPQAPAADADDQSDDKGTPQVFYGEDGLPDKVKEMRRRIIAAAKTGDIEALRPVLESNEMPPSLSGGDSDDPVATLKLLSGDGQGREILAILLDVMESGYAHVDVGTPQEMYVWPYFARYKLDKLTGPQMVELFRLITAGDFQDMQDKGVYSFYRVGIGPDGTWHYFEDGD